MTALDPVELDARPRRALQRWRAATVQMPSQPSRMPRPAILPLVAKQCVANRKHVIRVDLQSRSRGAFPKKGTKADRVVIRQREQDVEVRGSRRYDYPPFVGKEGWVLPSLTSIASIHPAACDRVRNTNGSPSRAKTNTARSCSAMGRACHRPMSAVLEQGCRAPPGRGPCRGAGREHRSVGSAA